MSASVHVHVQINNADVSVSNPLNTNLVVQQDGMVSLEELQQVLTKASKEFSHFEEHAKFLEAKNNRCGD